MAHLKGIRIKWQNFGGFAKLYKISLLKKCVTNYQHRPIDTYWQVDTFHSFWKQQITDSINTTN